MSVNQGKILYEKFMEEVSVYEGAKGDEKVDEQDAVRIRRLGHPRRYNDAARCTMQLLTVVLYKPSFSSQQRERSGVDIHVDSANSTKQILPTNLQSIISLCELIIKVWKFWIWTPFRA